MSGRKLVRRACDGCKIRKVKCSGFDVLPCENCKISNIPCTWLKQHQPRGPRRLRDATLQQIQRAQSVLQVQSQEAARRGTTRSVNVNDPDPPPQPSTEVSQLVLYLCVYRVQLYPIWPVIKVERLIASLQSESADLEVYALAYALAAATASRTKSTDLNISQRNHAQILEAKCQAYRCRVPPGRPPNLTTVRIAFFLHIYYESLEANSMRSMLYLREAVTIATMMGLHKEAYYNEVPEQERQIRRRVLWLLFVTERVIALLYEQPITLRTRIELPGQQDTDEADILTGFQQLARLFWTLDDQGMFSLLDELDVQASPSSNGLSNSSISAPINFAQQIQTDALYHGYVPPIQRLDLVVNRAWLCVMNYRIQQLSITSPMETVQTSVRMMISAIQDMVEVAEQSATELFESLGAALNLKLSTISGTLQELVSSPVSTLRSFQSDSQQKARDLSSRLSTVIAIHLRAANQIVRSPLQYSPSSISRPLATVTSPILSHSTGSSRGNGISPGKDGWIVSQPDFAVNNNYEGLFDAVEMAGVRSSDAVEDLFSQASLENYSTFDDQWPGITTPEASDIDSHLWSNPNFMQFPG